MSMPDFTSAIASKEASDASSEASRDQLEFSREQWNKFLGTLRPLEKEAAKPLEEQAGFAGQLASVERGYSDAAANVMRRTGGQYQYGAGAEEAKLQNLELSKSRDRAKVYADESTRKWDKLSTIASLTRGLPANASAGFSDVANRAQGNANTANMALSQSMANQGQSASDVYGIGQQQGWWGGSGGGGLDYSRLKTTAGGALYSL